MYIAAIKTQAHWVIRLRHRNLQVHYDPQLDNRSNQLGRPWPGKSYIYQQTSTVLIQNSWMSVQRVDQSRQEIKCQQLSQLRDNKPVLYSFTPANAVYSCQAHVIWCSFTLHVLQWVSGEVHLIKTLKCYGVYTIVCICSKPDIILLS